MNRIATFALVALLLVAPASLAAPWHEPYELSRTLDGIETEDRQLRVHHGHLFATAGQATSAEKFSERPILAVGDAAARLALDRLRLRFDLPERQDPFPRDAESLLPPLRHYATEIATEVASVEQTLDFLRLPADRAGQEAVINRALPGLYLAAEAEMVGRLVKTVENSTGAVAVTDLLSTLQKPETSRVLMEYSSTAGVASTWLDEPALALLLKEVQNRTTYPSPSLHPNTDWAAQQAAELESQGRYAPAVVYTVFAQLSYVQAQATTLAFVHGKDLMPAIAEHMAQWADSEQSLLLAEATEIGRLLELHVPEGSAASQNNAGALAARALAHFEAVEVLRGAPPAVTTEPEQRTSAGLDAWLIAVALIATMAGRRGPSRPRARQ